MKKKLSLFEGYGIEIEYIIGNKNTLSVSSYADLLIKNIAGKYTNEIILDKIILSNELVNHLIELKTNGPISSIIGFDKIFQKEINYINLILNSNNKLLIPTGMHPFFKPETETVLWQHKYKKIYHYYHKLFNCYKHGWANLQSTHLNLPFGNDDEFEKLLSAIRLILPIIPSLSASSPIMENNITGLIDNRLNVYMKNQSKIPIITGKVIPEKLWNKKEYETKLLKKIYDKIKPFDTRNILQYEWLNSRGAIARFERNTIEIRLLDTQETPYMDFTIISIITTLLQWLINKFENNLEVIKKFSTNELYKIFLDNVRKGSLAIIENEKYLKIFECNKNRMTSKDLWKYIIENFLSDYEEINYYKTGINRILAYGNLSERILSNINDDYSINVSINNIYTKLSDCLQTGSIY